MHSEIHSHRAIVIMGVSGSGKSTVGALLATELGCEFIDADDLHGNANVAKMAAGVPLDDADRLPWLDRVGHALHATATSNYVVCACSALKKTYRDRLVQAAMIPVSFVLLKVGRPDLEARLKARADHFMPLSLLDSQLTLLEAPTPDEQALTLDAMATPTELCKQIRQWLSNI